MVAHALRRGRRRLLEEGEGPDGWALLGGEREKGRRDGALAGWFGPSRPRREGENGFLLFFQSNFQSFFQIEF